MAKDIVDIILDNLKTMEVRINKNFDKIEEKIDKLVTKEDCKNNQDNCHYKNEIKKNDLSLRRMVAIGGILVSLITLGTIIITALEIIK